MKMIDKQSLRMISYGLSACFLLIHILLFLVFWKCGVTPMVLMNCFSIPFCLLSVFIIRRDAFRIYLDLIYFEVLIHMMLAIYFTGWGNGFQIPILTMYIIAYTGEYLTRTVGAPRPHALVLGIIAMVVYVTLFILSKYYTPAYLLPASVSSGLQLMWAIVFFVIGSTCLFNFVNVATHTELVLANEAERDKLTGLYNRTGYEKIFSGISVPSVTLLVIDADQFKSINDTYGHETGDRVLKRIAELLAHMFRSEDYICRIGGDEFAVLMKTAPELSENTIQQKVARINHDLSHPKDTLPPVSISVGVSFGQDCETASELFSNADQALYRVKAAGGKDCAFFRSNG